MIVEGINKALELIFNGGNTELNSILETTFQMCLKSSIISLLIAIPIGILLGIFNFKGKKIIIVLNRTLTGIPPVVCGLVCYLLFSGVGPLRHLKLLYTVNGMVIAQVLLITPVLIATIESFVSTIGPKIKNTTIGLKIPFIKTLLLIINELKYQLITTYLLGLARSMAEVGAISIVGGAIQWETNVMTTAIMQYTQMGYFSYAFALGLVLLTISLVINVIVSLISRGSDYDI